MDDRIMYGICGAFVGWELYARSCHGRYRGCHTLSNRVWLMQDRWPRTRWLVGGACAVQTIHLVFRRF